MPIAEKETQQQNTRIDLLNRREFVDKLLDISKLLAKNKKGACYAINGSWGVGKSFVLDMFEELAEIEGQEGEILNQYLIFRYDCWEYDYYDEPLVAIIASILEQYEKKVCLLNEDQRATIKATLQQLGIFIFNWGKQKLLDSTGIDISEVADLAKTIKENGSQMTEHSHDYDSLFELKKILRKLQDTIRVLSQSQTLIIIVDELDRCLPEYTIKVLERLHHLFDKIDNVQIVLSVDKNQLSHIVRQIYGEKTDVTKYLEKLINFEIKLDSGSLSDNIDLRFADYFSRFDIRYTSTTETDIREFKSHIFDGVDIRTSISIFEKCSLLHGLLSEDSTIGDEVLMCIEIFFTLLKYYKLDTEQAKSAFDISNLFISSKTFEHSNLEEDLPGLVFLRHKYIDSIASGKPYYFMDGGKTIVQTNDIWGVLLACYRNIIGFTEDNYLCKEYLINGLLEDAKIYWNLLGTII